MHWQVKVNGYPPVGKYAFPKTKTWDFQSKQEADAFFEAKREAQKGERLKQKGERAARAARQAASQGADGLRRLRDRLRQEIKIAENNILFFTAKSKTANKLVDSMQKKIDELKKQLEDIQNQLDNEE